MALAKTAFEPIRKLTKTGGHSYCITIPLDYVRNLGWKEHQKLVVKQKGTKLVIRDWKQ